MKYLLKNGKNHKKSDFSKIFRMSVLSYKAYFCAVFPRKNIFLAAFLNVY